MVDGQKHEIIEYAFYNNTWEVGMLARYQSVVDCSRRVIRKAWKAASTASGV